MNSTVLFALVILFYWKSTSYELVNFDDSLYFGGNPFIKNFDLPFLKWAFTSTYATNWHPLTWITYAIDYQLGGYGSFWPHLQNVMWHSGVTVLLFLMTRAIILHLQPNIRPLILEISCFFGALLFAVHPLRAESVVWVSERKDVVCAFFYLLTMLLYWRYLLCEKNKSQWLIGVHCSAVLAFLAKPMAVSLPLVLILIDLLVRRKITARVFIEKGGLCLAVLLLCVLNMRAQAVAISRRTVIPLESSIVNSLSVISFYLNQTFWPYDFFAGHSNLLPMYTFYENSGKISGFEIAMAGSSLALIGLTFSLLGRNLRIALAFYIITLLPVIGLVHFGVAMAADRYTYITLMPLVVLFVYGVSLALEKRKWIYVSLACAYFSAMLWAGWNQQEIWRNPITLWEHQCALLPRPLFLEVLGDNYMKRNNFLKAAEKYEQTLVLQPHLADVQLKAAIMNLKIGRIPPMRQHVDAAIRLDPNYAEAYMFRSQVNPNRKQALVDYQKAIELDPELRKSYPQLPSLK